MRTVTSNVSRAVMVVLLTAVAPLGCSSCPESVVLDTPEHTVDSFRRAFACDEKTLEYQCFSDRVKGGFGGLSNYAVGREIVRKENPLLPFFLKWSDLSDRLQMERLADGNTALARIDTGQGTMTIELVNEPEYLLYHEDGSTSRGFAQGLQFQPVRDGMFGVLVADRRFRDDPNRPVHMVELRPRWVINSLAGMDAALAAQN